MSRRMRLTLIAVMLFLPIACEQEAASTPTEPAMPSEEASAPEAQSYSVQVDGQAPGITSYMLAFFPREVSVHPGDTVEFQWVDTGEPHTVTFGGLVDDAVGSMAGADPTGPLPEEWEALPILIDDATFAVNQAAAQPCYLTDGEPGDEACAPAEQEQSAFDGNFSFYNSGWPEGAASFTVQIDPETAPGTYNYLCLLHVPFMSGVIEVVEPDAEVDSPDEVAARAEEEIAAQTALIEEAVGASAPATARDILAGVVPMSPDAISGANIFVPDDLAISAGEVVTWTIAGPHLMAFNAPAEAASLRTESDDGTVGLNVMGIGPSGGSPGMPAPPEAAEEAADGTPAASGDDQAAAEPTMDPNAPPPPPMLVNGGEWNGEAYYNSGLFVSFPPNMFAFALTFTEPGSYPYQCLIHPGMTGSVTVE